MRRREVVALVSGGLDSYALVACLLRSGAKVRPVYVRCGLRWEPVEQRALKRWLGKLRVGRLAVLDAPVRSLYGPQGHWSLTGRNVPGARSPDSAVYLPGRNLILLSHAAVYAARHGISTLALGLLAGNPFGDATPAFLNAFSRCATQALGRRISILTPLQGMSKTTVVRSTPPAHFALTFSCIQPRGLRHCGRCNKCAERRLAFRLAGIQDPTAYAS